MSAPDKDGVIAISKHPPNDFNEAKNAPQTILPVRKQLVSPFGAKLRTDPLIVRLCGKKRESPKPSTGNNNFVQKWGHGRLEAKKAIV